jgi:hypothetical protein
MDEKTKSARLGKLLLNADALKIAGYLNGAQ